MNRKNSDLLLKIKFVLRKEGIQKVLGFLNKEYCLNLT